MEPWQRRLTASRLPPKGWGGEAKGRPEGEGGEVPYEQQAPSARMLWLGAHMGGENEREPGLGMLPADWRCCGSGASGN